jgi:hypothetical protein
MSVVFRARSDLLAKVRADLHRRHSFARERVGFFTCQAGHLADGGVSILATGFEPVADEDYIENPRVGAMIGPAAIRKALQLAYNGGAEDISIFHVHMHGHRGMPGFSDVDHRESRRFVPDFFKVAPRMPHGALVLSKDQAFGLCWKRPDERPVQITRFASVGAPLKLWWWRR